MKHMDFTLLTRNDCASRSKRLMRFGSDQRKFLRKSIVLSAIYPLLVVSIICFAISGSAQKIKLIPHDATIDIQIDGRPFTTYHFNDDYFHTPVRPFLY